MANLLSVLVVILCFVAAHALRFGWHPVDSNYLIALLLALLLVSLVFPATGAFRAHLRGDFARKFRRQLAGWALVVTILIALAAMLKVTSSFSRVWFGNWVVFTSIGLTAGLLLTQFWQNRSRGLIGKKRRLVLVGDGTFAAEVEEKLLSADGRDFEIVGRFGNDWPGGAQSLAELSSFISNNEVNDVWISFSFSHPDFLDDTLGMLKDSMVDIHVIPNFEHYRLLNQEVTQWQGLPFINLSGTPMVGSERLLKTFMDRVGSACLILLALPLFFLIAVAVWLTSGNSVIFTQKRHGMDGKPIEVYKFRTMKKSRRQTFSQAEPGDKRTTSLGRILRRTSLDELPQLFNVLKGEMSLVGPRPHPVELDQFFRARIPRYMLRNKALPGMTGWAQVNGLRGLTETDEKMSLRIEHDLWYIQNWSIWLDLTILLRTPFVMIHRNAY